MTHRIQSWVNNEDITRLQHKGGVGVIMGPLDQGVLPPFSQPAKGLTGQFLDLQRRRPIDTPAAHSSLCIDKTVVDVVPRAGETLGWGEGGIRGRGTVSGKWSNLDSTAAAAVMASNYTLGHTAGGDTVGRGKHAAKAPNRSRSSSLPPGVGGTGTLPEAEAVASSMRAHAASWRDAFVKFPRQADGTIRVRDFVDRLAALASVAVPSTTPAVDATAPTRTLSHAELKRVADLLDPARTGVITFPAFAKVFSSALSAHADAASLKMDGSRTHTRGHGPRGAELATSWHITTPAVINRPAPPSTTPAPPAWKAGDDEAADVAGVAEATTRATPLPLATRAPPLTPPRGDVDGAGGLHASDAGAEAGTPRTLGAASAATGTTGRKRPGATRAAPALSGSERVMPAEALSTVALSNVILEKAMRQHGTHPSSLRKMFLRMPRTKDGTTSVVDMAACLQAAGVASATPAALSALLGLPPPAPSNAGGGVDVAQRVSYDTFALALASTTLNRQPINGVTPRRGSVAGGGTEPRDGGGGEGGAPGTITVPTNALLAAANAAHSHNQMASTNIIAAMTDPLAARERLIATPKGEGMGVTWAPDAWDNGGGGGGGGATGSVTSFGAGGDGVGRTRSIVPGAYTSGKRMVDPERVMVADALTRVQSQLYALGKTPTELFLRMDKQRDGFLTHAELKRGLSSLGVALSDPEFGRVMTVMDRTGSGAVDHASFVAAVFPPDIHPRTKAFPFERGSRGAKTRRARQELQKWSVTPQYDMLRSDEDADAAPLGARGKTAEGDPGDGLHVDAYGSDEEGDGEAHAPTWLHVPTVDSHGLYQTERDLTTEGVTTTSRRHFNLDQPAPYLHGTLQPRDTWGTPAPHLTPAALRAVMKSEADARATTTAVRGVDVTPLERSMWAASRGGGGTCEPAGGLSVGEIQAGKRKNAILRRVIEKLSCRSRDAREVWLKLNNNHDGTCDPREMREGLSRLGVHLSAEEFKLFLRRIDVDGSRTISFDEFARAFKGDDPIPDELYLASMGVTGVAVRTRDDKETDPVAHQTGYRRHRYVAVGDAPALPGQGIPRHQGMDSRGAWLSLQAGGGGSAMAAGSLEEARMQLEVVDRLEAKSHQGLRAVFTRLTGEGGVGSTTASTDTAAGGGCDATATVPADPKSLRARLQSVGITLSERQVAAFLRPVLQRAGSDDDARSADGFGAEGAAGRGGDHGTRPAPSTHIDYATFVELARPRAVPAAVLAGGGGAGGSPARSITSGGGWMTPLRSPLPVGQPRRSSVDAGDKPLLGTAEGEGIGRYGTAPDVRAEAAASVLPVTAADYVRKTNTSATGVSWDELADASARLGSRTLTRGRSRRVGSPSSPLARAASSASLGGKTAMQAAAEAEWSGLPAAGKLAVESDRRGRNESQRLRSLAEDHVRSLLTLDTTNSLGTTYRDLHGGAVSMGRGSHGEGRGDASGTRPPPPTTAGGRGRRAASAEPMPRTQGRGQPGPHGLGFTLPSAGLLEVGAWHPLSGGADTHVTPAGVSSPRQPRVITAATMLAAPDTARSRRKEVATSQGRMFHGSVQGVLTDTDYPTADPAAIADARIKRKRGLYSAQRAEQAIVDTMAPAVSGWHSARDSGGDGSTPATTAPPTPSPPATPAHTMAAGGAGSARTFHSGRRHIPGASHQFMHSSILLV